MSAASAISLSISTATVRRGWKRRLTYSGRMTSNLKDMSDRDFNCMMVQSWCWDGMKSGVLSETLM